MTNKELKIRDLEGTIALMQKKLKELKEPEEVTIVSAGVMNTKFGVMLSDGKMLVGLTSISVDSGFNDFAEIRITALPVRIDYDSRNNNPNIF